MATRRTPLAALLLMSAGGVARATCDGDGGTWDAVQCTERGAVIETIEIDPGSIERRGPWVLYEERRRYLRPSDGREAIDGATGAALNCLTLARGSTRYARIDLETDELVERKLTLEQVEDGAGSRRSIESNPHWDRLCSCDAATGRPADAAPIDESTVRAVHDRYVASQTAAATYGVDFVTTGDPEVASLIERDLARGAPFADVADEYNHPAQPPGGYSAPRPGRAFPLPQRDALASIEVGEHVRLPDSDGRFTWYFLREKRIEPGTPYERSRPAIERFLRATRSCEGMSPALLEGADRSSGRRPSRRRHAGPRRARTAYGPTP